MVNRIKKIFINQNKTKHNIFRISFDIMCILCLILWIIDDWIIIVPDIINIIAVVILMLIFIPRIVVSQNIKKMFKGVPQLQVRWFVGLLAFGIAIDIYVLGVLSVFENLIGLIVFVSGNLIYYVVIKKLFICSNKSKL